MKRNNLFLIAFLFLFMAFSSSEAQPGGGPGGGGGGGPEDPVPIDGGITLLIGAGAALGAKKTYDLRKKKDKDI